MTGKAKKLKRLAPTPLSDSMLGIYFGFPDCCIREVKLKTPKKLRASVLGGGLCRSIDGYPTGCSGFLPCLDHVRQIDAGEITLFSLITHRVCPQPFPGNGVEGVLDRASLYAFFDRAEELAEQEDIGLIDAAKLVAGRGSP